MHLNVFPKAYSIPLLYCCISGMRFTGLYLLFCNLHCNLNLHDAFSCQIHTNKSAVFFYELHGKNPASKSGQSINFSVCSWLNRPRKTKLFKDWKAKPLRKLIEEHILKNRYAKQSFKELILMTVDHYLSSLSCMILHWIFKFCFEFK